ncbi:GumC family protein [Neorhizobium alkalisoli]|jgi:uncharacterized protein involved in exopolysaccharide biosynthesis|uniref:Uncharacterized protein involved in exopolysaccharide biosynthesis n=1 Tax=Neorhizobium alkalisoli TaxID=528178 RepID=A0A561QAL8_9HYPH|nr:GumC family protein [Neorhizobium alkalisoli]TWF47412.1 uncharacterized protein involved in exopolysaccharide biosynthesis [Neorhizobium alkalisoli]
MSFRDRDAMEKGARAPSLLNYIARDNSTLRRTPGGSKTNPPHPKTDTPVSLDGIGEFLELDLRRILVWLRDGIKLAIVVGIVCAILAACYGLLAKPRYTVSSEVYIEPANLQVINNDLYAQPLQQGDRQALVIANRARLMTSGNVLTRVVQTLKLAQDPEFYQPPSGLFSSQPSSARANADAELGALKSLRKKITLNADGRTFIAELLVTAWTADKAIAISNAIVTSFNAELAGTEAQTAGRAASALDERLAALKSSALAADEAVESYKRTHGLSTGENGQLVSSQAMTQTNTQILAARTRVINAQTNYNSLSRANDTSTATIPEFSDTLRELKLRTSALEQQLGAQETTYGDRHPSISKIRNELATAREQVRIELRRAINVAKAELDRANEALKQVTANMTALESASFSDGQSQVELRELQRDAQAKTQIYDSFLVRVGQIAERERITTDTVRVVTPPVPPSGRSWPPGPAMLFVVGGILGFMLGLGLSVIRGIVSDLRRQDIAG